MTSLRFPHRSVTHSLLATAGITAVSLGVNYFFNGKLTVDFPEDVKLPIERNQMATASLSGNSIKFDYCSLDKAIALLKEQFAVGTVEVRIISFTSISL